MPALGFFLFPWLSTKRTPRFSPANPNLAHVCDNLVCLRNLVAPAWRSGGWASGRGLQPWTIQPSATWLLHGLRSRIFPPPDTGWSKANVGGNRWRDSGNEPPIYWLVSDARSFRSEERSRRHRVSLARHGLASESRADGEDAHIARHTANGGYPGLVVPWGSAFADYERVVANLRSEGTEVVRCRTGQNGYGKLPKSWKIFF